MSDGRGRGGEIKTVVAGAVSLLAGQRNRGLVTVLSGSEVGRVVSLLPGTPVKLGRSDECTLQFEDASLSRVHATLMVVTGTAFLLRDEGSTNGSFVNDLRVGDPAILKDGDRIQLGTSTLLRFSIVDETEEAALKRVFEAGRTDALTGVANRKSFEERLDAEYAYAVRHASALSLVLMDVDFFKKINDTHGHTAGDAALRGVAAALARGVRTEDTLARFGGEEFAVIVRGVEASGAARMADRLRVAVGKDAIVFEEKSIAVTMSGGVASLACCGKSADKATLVSLADTRLYKAKQTGRNRVVGPD